MTVEDRFATKTIEQCAKERADYLLNGEIIKAKYDDRTQLYKFLIGISISVCGVQDKIKELYDNYNPVNTQTLLEEWEEYVGIPDDCFIVENTRQKRINNILFKLRKNTAVTIEDFQNLATILGATVVVVPGTEQIGFPIDFPIPFGTFFFQDSAWFMNIIAGAGLEDLIKCIFNKLKPANTVIIYRA